MKFVLENDTSCVLSLRYNAEGVPTLWMNNMAVAYFVGRGIYLRDLSDEHAERLTEAGVHCVRTDDDSTTVYHYTRPERQTS